MTTLSTGRYEPIPDGAECIKAAARRTGYERKTLLAILDWHGVEVYKATSARSHTWAWRREIDDAVKSWLRTESLRSAARRAGVDHTTMRSWLEQAGYEPPQKTGMWRVPSKLVDSIITSRMAPRRAA